MFTSILVAVDGSEHADRALELACKLAKLCGAKLHLVHTPQLEVVAMAVGVTPVVLPYSEEEIAKAGTKVMDQATAICTAHGCTPETAHIEQGDPAHVIQRRAEEISTDLLVTGRRGLGKITGLLLGSVSQKISQIAPCAHITVP